MVYSVSNYRDKPISYTEFEKNGVFLHNLPMEA